MYVWVCGWVWVCGRVCVIRDREEGGAFVQSHEALPGYVCVGVWVGMGVS